MKKKAKRKAPTRTCEGCAASYFPRSAKCPNCGRPNPVLTRRAVSADAVGAAIEFVEQAGSIKAAVTALDKIERIKGMR